MLLNSGVPNYTILNKDGFAGLVGQSQTRRTVKRGAEEAFGGEKKGKHQGKGPKKPKAASGAPKTPKEPKAQEKAKDKAKQDKDHGKGKDAGSGKPKGKHHGTGKDKGKGKGKDTNDGKTTVKDTSNESARVLDQQEKVNAQKGEEVRAGEQTAATGPLNQHNSVLAPEKPKTKADLDPGVIAAEKARLAEEREIQKKLREEEKARRIAQQKAEQEAKRQAAEQAEKDRQLALQKQLDAEKPAAEPPKTHGLEQKAKEASEKSTVPVVSRGGALIGGERDIPRGTKGSKKAKEKANKKDKSTETKDLPLAHKHAYLTRLPGHNIPLTVSYLMGGVGYGTAIMGEISDTALLKISGTIAALVGEYTAMARCMSLANIGDKEWTILLLGGGGMASFLLGFFMDLKTIMLAGLGGVVAAVVAQTHHMYLFVDGILDGVEQVGGFFWDKFKWLFDLDNSRNSNAKNTGGPADLLAPGGLASNLGLGLVIPQVADKPKGKNKNKKSNKPKKVDPKKNKQKAGLKKPDNRPTRAGGLAGLFGFAT